MTTTPSAATESLSSSECWAQLRRAVVGRLAVVIGGRPDIFPVNYVVDHGTVVFRTGAGTKLAAARTMDVAFEVDGYDAGTAQAWSVVLKGDASEVREVDDTIRALRLPLFPWHGGRKPHVVRITPTSVTGRRFLVSGGFTTGPDPDGGPRDVSHAEPEPGVDP